MYLSAVDSQQEARAANGVKSVCTKELSDSAAIEAIEWASQQTSVANDSRAGVSYQSSNGGQLFSPPKALFSPPKQPMSRTSVFSTASPSNLQSPWRNGNTQQQNAYARSLSLPQPVSDQFVNGVSTWGSPYYASPNSRLNVPCSVYAVPAPPPPPAHTATGNHATPYASPNASAKTGGHLASSLSNGLLVSSSCALQPVTRSSPHFASPHSLMLLNDSTYAGQRFADAQLDAFASEHLSVGLGTSGNANMNGTATSTAYEHFGNLPLLVSSPSGKNSNLTITLNINNQLYQQDAAEYEALVNSLRDEAGRCDLPPGSSNVLLAGPTGSNQPQNGHNGPVESPNPGQHQKCYAVSAEQNCEAGTTSARAKRVLPVPKVNKTDEFDDDFELPPGATDTNLTRVERKRYRNRVAARKCRARKMERIVELEERARILRDEIAFVQERTRCADEQVRALRARIHEHVTNGCAIDYDSATTALVKADPTVLTRELIHENGAGETGRERECVTQPEPEAEATDAATDRCVTQFNMEARSAAVRADFVATLGGDQTLFNDAASSTTSYAHDALSNASRTPESIKSGAPPFACQETHADSLKHEDHEDIKVLLM